MVGIPSFDLYYKVVYIVPISFWWQFYEQQMTLLLQVFFTLCYYLKKMPNTISAPIKTSATSNLAMKTVPILFVFCLLHFESKLWFAIYLIIFPHYMEGKRCYFILVTFPLQSDTSNLSCNGIYFILLPTFCLYVSRVSLFVCCQICQSLIKTDCEQIESQFAGWLLGSSST